MEHKKLRRCIVRHRQTHRKFYPSIGLPILIVMALCLAVAAQESTQDADGERFFLDQIEPVLKTHCLECHSHSSGEMEGGLTLDWQRGWAVGGDQGPAIVPGKPEKSLLIKAVKHSGADLQMPPEEKLSDKEIELLVEWIRRGAPDPRTNQPKMSDQGDPTDWWSLRPLKRPAVPQTAKTEGEEINPIDAFVRRQLRSKGLTSTPRADRRTLIRRLSFDLHGLAPSPDEVDSFENDLDPAAYMKLINRLLDSPRYGEHWARHWLDAVHFADSHGCEHDVFRPNAWHYRDYVIASFNRDTQWSRFIREQLAADWFYPEQTHLTAALGFISAGPLELSRASTAPVTFDYLERDDIVTQTMAVFASTTANCARCHTHKFDPITQDDYYSLQAVFAGGGKGDVEYDIDPEVAKKRQRWNAVLEAAKNKDESQLLSPEHVESIAMWEQNLGENTSLWQPLFPKTFLSSDGATLTRLDDNSLLASGNRPDKDTYTISASPSLKTLTSLRLDVLTDDRLPMKGPGRCDNGNLHLSEISAFLFDAEDAEPKQLTFRKARADWNQSGWTIDHAIDGNIKTAWGIFPKVGDSHYAVFELEQPVELTYSSQIVIQLQQQHGGSHLIGRFKLYVTDADSATAIVLPDAVRTAIKLPGDDRSIQQDLAVASYVLQRKAEQELADLPSQTSVYAWSSQYSHGKKLPNSMTPKTVHVLRRGDIEKPGNVAMPGALSAIQILPSRFELKTPNDEASRRAALADWLAENENPLTWRSIVNRVWMQHFGRGLCETPNDFGRMGGVPSHPELLDWLAVWFRDDANGSLKELHRLILSSSTWKQQARITSRSTIASPENDGPALDTENRFLWRMTPRPLDAESFRDAVLQISGRIDFSAGGPGVQQFTQTKGAQLTPYLDYGAFDWKQPEAARRSIYRVVWRGTPDPFMESLDFPDLGLLPAKRGYSVSALQALALFNNDFVLHHSQVLANKLQAEHVNLDEQLVQALRLIHLRKSNSNEIELLVAYAQQHGLAATCRVLLNSNEFMIVY